MSAPTSERIPRPPLSAREYRFVLVIGLVALAITSIPYALGAALETDARVFGGFVYALEDCYSYLAKMRQGAEGAWLFHIAYTSEPHMGTLFFPFHLLLGKVAALLPGSDLTARMVWVYHGARWIFGLGLLVTVYRFLAAFTERVTVRRVAWLLVTFSGGLGWLLVFLGESDWLGSLPLDFILPEGFTFLVLYGFPHIALGRTLLLWGLLFLLRAWGVDCASRVTQRASRIDLGWALSTGFLWLLMGLIVPFYVPVAWAVTGAAWAVLGLRRVTWRAVWEPVAAAPGPRRWLAVLRVAPALGRSWLGTWREAGLAALAGLLSAPVVVYSLWVFTSDPVYAVWSSQNLILSPHPLHYLAAYGVMLALAALAVRDAWRDERPLWLALAWVGLVPLLVYLPFNLQRRLVEGVQVALSLLAGMGLLKASKFVSRVTRGKRQVASGRWQVVGGRRWLAVGVVLLISSLTNVLLVTGSSLMLSGRPAPVYRDAGEVAALDWLGQRVAPDEVVLTAYETGNYLPARAWARVFVGHGPETVRFAEKKAMMVRFFDGATDDAWRQDLLSEHDIDYVFWGPAERQVGDFDPRDASYLHAIYDADGCTIFEVE